MKQATMLGGPHDGKVIELDQFTRYHYFGTTAQPREGKRLVPDRYVCCKVYSSEKADYRWYPEPTKQTP